MEIDSLKKKLESHKKWLANSHNGERADLRYAYLRYAYLRNADLRYADLRNADLRNADLSNADLHNAYLRNAELDFTTKIDYHVACPDTGAFTAWKNANGYIVKLLIPETAKRSSATSRKCRCDKAKVLAIEDINGNPSCKTEVSSSYDINFIYRVGEIVEEPNFCENRWNECAPGIHFFITRIEAVNYSQ